MSLVCWKLLWKVFANIVRRLDSARSLRCIGQQWHRAHCSLRLAHLSCLDPIYGLCSQTCFHLGSEEEPQPRKWTFTGYRCVDPAHHVDFVILHSSYWCACHFRCLPSWSHLSPRRRFRHQGHGKGRGEFRCSIIHANWSNSRCNVNVVCLGSCWRHLPATILCLVWSQHQSRTLR